jgi:hypothetical protein
MDHPDEPARFSYAAAGLLEDEPENIISVVVTDSENKAQGILEKWTGDAWIYAEREALEDLN